jgi:hypothetical protein
MPAHVRADDLSALVWATAFDTGDAKVDCEQHELLVDINELSRCQAEGRKWSQIVGISKLLRDKCFAHFSRRTVRPPKLEIRQARRPRATASLYRATARRCSRLHRRRHAALARRGRSGAFSSLDAIHHFFRYDLAYKPHPQRVRNRGSRPRSRETR